MVVGGNLRSEEGRVIPTPTKMAELESQDVVAELKRKSFAKEELARNQSMAVVLGREGKFVAKGAAEGKAIAVFTSGGDAQGVLSFIFSWQNF